MECGIRHELSSVSTWFREINQVYKHKILLAVASLQRLPDPHSDALGNAYHFEVRIQIAINRRSSILQLNFNELPATLNLFSWIFNLNNFRSFFKIFICGVCRCCQACQLICLEQQHYQLSKRQMQASELKLIPHGSRAIPLPDWQVSRIRNLLI